MNNTCPQFFEWYSIGEKVSNSIFIFRAVIVPFLRNKSSAVMFFQRFIFSTTKFREKLPNCPWSNFSWYVDLFQEISPRIVKQLRFQVKLHHLRRKCKNDNYNYPEDPVFQYPYLTETTTWIDLSKYECIPSLLTIFIQLYTLHNKK
jgi:hypothetical protein